MSERHTECSVTNSLIKKYNGKVFKFKDLPKEAQAAIAHYMAIDGEAWEHPEDFPFKTTSCKYGEAVFERTEWWAKEYGSEKFGLVVLPTEEIIRAIMSRDSDMTDDFGKGVENFPAYHDWYLNHIGQMPNHKNSIWPVILRGESGRPFEFLEDGWHRFHDYVRKEVKEIPALWYPE